MSLVPMLKGEARPCLTCTARSCASVLPYAPAALCAFAEGDVAGAYERIRESNILPEMSSQVCPLFTQAEAACIETQEGRETVPIREIVYVTSQVARTDRLTRVRLTATETRKKVAVIGGGPAGVAGATKLLEQGHHVVLFERDEKLGGAPDKLFRSGRYAEAQTEINAILQRALNAHRLEIRYRRALGRQVKLPELQKLFEATLICTGLWQEYKSIGDSDLVIDSISFLQSVKSGARKTVPDNVAILGGGDAAMDAAAAVYGLGVKKVYIIFPDDFSQMHWHMPDDWFDETGAQLLDMTQPLGAKDGLQICRTEINDGELFYLPDTESTLDVGLIIEARGLEISEATRKEMEPLGFTDYGLVAESCYATAIPGIFVAGGLINGGVAVSRCVAEGMAAAAAMQQYLNNK
jgi:NADPH-dependent glutamate synthase beta subunit-like oxidoreductase